MKNLKFFEKWGNKLYSKYILFKDSHNGNSVGGLTFIWKSRRSILEGMRMYYFPKAYVEKIANKRLNICKTNICGFYDELGVQETTIVKGQTSCANCGCVLKFKTRSLSSACPLTEKGFEGYWDREILDENIEDNFRSATGIKNE